MKSYICSQKLLSVSLSEYSVIKREFQWKQIRSQQIYVGYWIFCYNEWRYKEFWLYKKIVYNCNLPGVIQQRLVSVLYGLMIKWNYLRKENVPCMYNKKFDKRVSTLC